MLEPVTVTETLTQQVQRRVVKHIVTSGLEPGDRIPGECELAEILGVSRNTVRESIKTLESIGIVARKRGSSTVLQPVDMSLLAEPMHTLLLRSEDDLIELAVARQVHEVSLLPLVARNISESDYEELEKANQVMESNLDAGKPITEPDAAFHSALLHAAGNKFLAQFGALIQEFFKKRPAVHISRDHQLRTVIEHRQMIAFLKAGDVEAAQRVMQEHLSRSLDPPLSATPSGVEVPPVRE